MANHPYPTGRQAFFDKQISWNVDTIKALLLTAGYTQSDAHDFLNDIPGGAVRVSTATLTGRTTTGGVCDADPTTFPVVPAGSPFTQLILYMDTGTEATSRLIYYFDTKSDTTPINVTPNGSDIVVTWPTTGIFR